VGRGVAGHLASASSCCVSTKKEALKPQNCVLEGYYEPGEDSLKAIKATLLIGRLLLEIGL
jgi:hypothetical protein